MFNLTDRQLLDIKSVLYLRQKTTESFQKETKQLTLTWNTRNLNALSKRIQKIYAKGITVRALRLTLTASITDKTPFPTNSQHNSRLDLVCRYLGYEDFINFQELNQVNINQVILMNKTESYFQRKTESMLTRTVYFTEPTVELLNKNTIIEKKHTLIYAIAYYSSFNEKVLPALISMNPVNGNMKIELQLFDTAMYDQDHIYQGSYEWTEQGYLFAHGRLLNYPEIQIYFQGYTNKSYLKSRWFIGTFNSISTYLNSSVCGIGVMEFAKDFENARQLLATPVDKRIEYFLKGKRLETPHKAWYSLDELLQG